MPQPDSRLCPAEIAESLTRYANQRVPTGSFLRAVLENNLMGAIGTADSHNRDAIEHICAFVHNRMPGNCHGSPKIVQQWLHEQGNDQFMSGTASCGHEVRIPLSPLDGLDAITDRPCPMCLAS